MILKEVRDNKIESFVIVSIFIVFITLVVYFICMYLELGILSIVIAVLFSTITSVISYYNCDKIVLRLNGARPATMEEDRQIVDILDNLCIATNLPKPKLFVIDDQSPNAFATGRNPSNAIICLTTGIIEKMNKYELEGVMAHELSHIKNYDILLSTIVSVFVGFVIMAVDIIFRGRFLRVKSNDNNKSGSIIVLIGIIFLILSPIFATLMQLAISRKREYLADATAIEITRNPNGLISALKKIDSEVQGMKNANKATAHMFLVNPLKEAKKEKTSLLSTHPAITERIARLENIN